MGWGLGSHVLLVFRGLNSVYSRNTMLPINFEYFDCENAFIICL